MSPDIYSIVKSTHVEGTIENKPSRSSHKKICLLTKSQPPTWLLALSVPIFLFWQLNKLLPLWMASSKNEPAESSGIEKYAYGPSFSLLHGSWLSQDKFSYISHKIDYPYRRRYSKINKPGLHTVKKYAFGPSFSLLYGSWLCQDPFVCFNH